MAVGTGGIFARVSLLSGTAEERASVSLPSGWSGFLSGCGAQGLAQPGTQTTRMRASSALSEA